MKNINKLKYFNGDWGLGIGDWGLGIGDWAQSPIPNPQSPIPNPHYIKILNFIQKKFKLKHNIKFFINKYKNKLKAKKMRTNTNKFKSNY